MMWWLIVCISGFRETTCLPMQQMRDQHECVFVGIQYVNVTNHARHREGNPAGAAFRCVALRK